MRFHDYVTVKSRKNWLNCLPISSSEFRKRVASAAMLDIPIESDPSDDENLKRCVMLEHLWFECNRPFFNVWPPVLEMVDHVDLSSVPMSAVTLPVSSLLVRIPHQHHHVQWMLCQGCDKAMDDSAQMVMLACVGKSEAIFSFRRTDKLSDYVGIDGGSVNDDLMSTNLESIQSFAVRLLALLCLLSDDPRIIQPVVLASDRCEYMITKDDERKRLLELRSIRKQGLGYDIGRDWHETRDTSPHFRNAHLCLFWTGRDRNTPVVKLRKGCMVQPRKMLEIPTGYMGPE